jgi:hypothetical protein
MLLADSRLAYPWCASGLRAKPTAPAVLEVEFRLIYSVFDQYSTSIRSVFDPYLIVFDMRWKADHGLTPGPGWSGADTVDTRLF